MPNPCAHDESCVFRKTYLFSDNGAECIAKENAALTGPVMTLLDFVVHVPVSCGSVCANTKDRSTALAANDDRGKAIMKCGRWKISNLSRLESGH